MRAKPPGEPPKSILVPSDFILWPEPLILNWAVSGKAERTFTGNYQDVKNYKSTGPYCQASFLLSRTRYEMGLAWTPPKTGWSPTWQGVSSSKLFTPRTSQVHLRLWPRESPPISQKVRFPPVLCWLVCCLFCVNARVKKVGRQLEKKKTTRLRWYGILVCDT